MKPTLRELMIVDLMRDYVVYRERYFGKTIPPIEQVAIAMLPKRAFDTIYPDDHGCIGYAVYGPRHRVGATTIAVYEDSGETERVSTLIHEMAHIKLECKWKRDMGHGKYWQAEMKRLAAAGAFKNCW